MNIHHARILLITAALALLAGCSAESKKNQALERGLTYFKTGDYERARLEYQTVLQKFPDDPNATEHLALIWYERGATLRALNLLAKMTTLAPGNLDLRLKKARLLFAIGRIAEARNEAAAIIKSSSSAADAFVLLTESVRDPEDLKAADDLMQKHQEKGKAPYHLAAANLANLRGDLNGAKAAVQRALALDPKSAAAHAALAGVHARQGNTPQALAEYKTAAELAPLRSPERLAQIHYLIQNGSSPEALTLLNDVVRQAPDYLPALHTLAQVALTEKRYDDAIGFLQKALGVEASDHEALILRARIRQARGEIGPALEEFAKFGATFKGLNLEKYYLALAHLQNRDEAAAIVALQQSLALFPDQVEAGLLLAKLQIRAGTPQPAVEAMTSLVSRRPDLLQAYETLIEATKALGKLAELATAVTTAQEKSPQNAQLHYLLGRVRVEQKQGEAARKSFEQALAAAPNLLAAWFELAELDLREGKTADALQRAQVLVEKLPNLAAGHLLLGRVLAIRGDWNAAYRAAAKTTELDPNNRGANGLLADFFMARVKQPETLPALDAYLQRHPNEQLATLLGGQIYTAAGQFARARDLYEAYVKMNPSSGIIYNNLANLYADNLGNLPKALETARKARALEPTSPSVADTLGWILYQQKDYVGALPLVEEAARNLPDNPEIQLHVGLVQRNLGNEAAAQAALRRAAQSPGTSTVKSEAKRLLAAGPAAPAKAPTTEQPKQP